MVQNQSELSTMDYGVPIKNKFCYLVDDGADDPSEVLKKLQEEKKEKPKAKEPKKVTKVAPPAKKAVEVKKPNEAKTEPKKEKDVKIKDGASRGRGNTARGTQQDGASGGWEEIAVRTAPKKSVQFVQESAPRGRDTTGNGQESAPRGRGATGRGNMTRGTQRDAMPSTRRNDSEENGVPKREHEGAPRGRGSGRGSHRGGGLLHDRHSGSDKTGVRAVDKKGGHGTGNWGDKNDEIVGATEPVPKIESDTVQAQESATADQPTEEQKMEQDKEAAKNAMTLSEFKAQFKKKEEAHFNTRKAGEGQDTKVYAKLVPLKKDVIEEQKVEYETIVKNKPTKSVSHLLGFKVETSGQVSGNKGGKARETRPGPSGSGGGSESAQSSSMVMTEDFPVIGKP